MFAQPAQLNHFIQAVDNWIKELDQYTINQLLAKPAETSWSLGQLYVHLIQSTHFFLKQAHACTTHNENINEEAYPEAKAMFSNNDFPNAQLDGPPSNTTTPQPNSKEQIVNSLTTLKEKIQKAAALASQTPFKGKTKHFGLGYFTAAEWLQFAEMHFRHHLRQKKRLDEFLIANNIT